MITKSIKITQKIEKLRSTKTKKFKKQKVLPIINELQLLKYKKKICNDKGIRDLFIQNKYINQISSAFNDANNNKSKITKHIINMGGMTGIKTRHFYNNLVNMEDARYLEIGVWTGSSVSSAMCGNKAKIVCMDNFSEFTETLNIKKIFLNNFNKYKGKNNATFIEADCFKYDISKLPKFNIYLFDANHEEKSHYKALVHYYECLDDIFIFIVDDWNLKDVRDGTYRSFKKLNLKIIYDREVRLTWNDEHTYNMCDKLKLDNGKIFGKELGYNTWHNGIYIAVLQKLSF
jgi:hypothetical protein